MGRQAWEGALAYSSTALADVQKTVPFRTIVKYAFALQRECDACASLNHAERLTRDQLQVALMQASPAYAAAKFLDESAFKSFEAPAEAPSSGDIIGYWTQASILIGKPPS